MYIITIDLHKNSVTYFSNSKPSFMQSKDGNPPRLMILDNSTVMHIFNWDHVLSYHCKLIKEGNDQSHDAESE